MVRHRHRTLVYARADGWYGWECSCGRAWSWHAGSYRTASRQARQHREADKDSTGRRDR